MLRSFEVQNFRLFRELHLKDLQRVNIIAGKNSCGKSSLLEAILTFLGRNNPILAAKLNAYRGLSVFKRDAVEVWGWMFRGRAVEMEVAMKGYSDGGKRVHVTFALKRNASRNVAIDSVRERGVSELSKDVVAASDDEYEYTVEWDDSSSGRGRSRGRVEGDRIWTERDNNGEEGASGALYLSARPPLVGYEALQQFSEFDSQGKAEVLVEPLKTVEPRLRRLAILTAAGQPILCADVGLPRLVPLGLLGDGVSLLLRIITAITASSGKVVLIDEIENGFHHSVIETVWKVIDKISREFDTQVFAATHSLECIRAAHAAFTQSDSYDLALYRLDRMNDDIKIVRYDRETLDTSVDQNMEVR